MHDLTTYAALFYNHYFLLIIYIYKIDNLPVKAITTTMAALFILMTGVSVILSAENTNEEINQRI